MLIEVQLLMTIYWLHIWITCWLSSWGPILGSERYHLDYNQVPLWSCCTPNPWLVHRIHSGTSMSSSWHISDLHQQRKDQVARLHLGSLWSCVERMYQYSHNSANWITIQVPPSSWCCSSWRYQNRYLAPSGMIDSSSHPGCMIRSPYYHYPSTECTPTPH